MAFRISASLGDEKPFFRITCRAPPGREHVEVLIDDKSIDREHASRLLRAMPIASRNAIGHPTRPAASRVLVDPRVWRRFLAAEAVPELGLGSRKGFS
jgi:hypothetical protein